MASCTPTLRCGRHRAPHHRGTYGSDPSPKTALRGSLREVSRRQVFDCRNRWPSPRCGLSHDPGRARSLPSRWWRGVPRMGEQLPTMWTELLQAPTPGASSAHCASMPPTMWTAALAIAHCPGYAPHRTISKSGTRRRSTRDLNQNVHVVL